MPLTSSYNSIGNISNNPNADIVFSDYQTSVANTDEIDSGWIDMGTADKYQVSLNADTPGCILQIQSSSDPSGTGATVTSSTTVNSVFHLFNVIVRQRYVRIRWRNQTGSDVNNMAVQVKLTYGSSDKLSVFPLSTQPTDFSQAALVQAVTRGQQPDGDYVATPADGTAFTTTSNLGIGAIYESSWVDTDGWNTVRLVISSDQVSASQGIEIEFTDDVQAGTPTVRFTKNYEFPEQAVDDGFKEISFPSTLDGFRLRYTNGDVATTSFFIDASLRVNSDSNIYNKGGALVNSDFGTEVALGKISNYSIGTKFGQNPDVDPGVSEDMWNGGSDYTGHPVSFTPETVDIFSADANDTSAGTGARTIRIFGLETETSEDYTFEDITMNGTTAVTSTKSWWRVNRAFVLTAGSNGRNEGTITVRSTTTTANVFVQMPTYGQTTIGAYTVPFNSTMIVKRIRVQMARANGSAGSGTVSLLCRENSPDAGWRAPRVFAATTNSPTDFTSVGGLIFPAGSDIKFRIEDVSDTNTIVEGAFEYYLIKN